jgi:WD40 repeat protein
LYGHHLIIISSTYLYTGNLCLGGTDSGRIYVWDLVNCHRPLAVLHGHSGAVNTMNFSVDGMTMMMIVMMMMMMIVVMVMISMNIMMIIIYYY